MSRSRIYILDEPTRGVDVASKTDIYNSMLDLVTKGASIILISSDMEEILGMCDRVLVLAEGQITGEFSRSEATKEAILYKATIKSN
jgi:ribose transport system ATP-binding protein